MLIAAHGNSLRALVKHLDGISEEEIVGLNIPTGIPLVYELDDDLKPLRTTTWATPRRRARPPRRSRSRRNGHEHRGTFFILCLKLSGEETDHGQTVVRLLAAVCAALLAGCGGDSAAKQGKGGREAGAGGGERNAESGANALPSREVQLAHAETGHLARTVTVSGTLAADEQAELAMKVAGRLADLAVDLGDRVRQGQVLARLVAHRLPAPRRAGGDRPGAGAGPPRPPAGRRRDRRRTPRGDRGGPAGRRRPCAQARLTPRPRAAPVRASSSSRAPTSTPPRPLRVAEARYQDAVEEVRNRQALLLAQRRSELELAQQQLADSVLRRRSTA